MNEFREDLWLCRSALVVGGYGPCNELKSLIMAQIERWRQASYMQVERERPFGAEYSGGRVSNA